MANISPPTTTAAMALLLEPRIADDADFAAMKRLIDDDAGWTMELSKPTTQVWTRNIDGCNFHMVKMSTTFEDIPADVVYDVLLDPDYRRDWDSHMLASEDIGCLNVNNDIGYYAMSCPAPLKPRDFVLMRSWLDTGPQGEQMLLSRSVTHKDWPPKKGFVRAMSYITGFVIRAQPNGGCLLGYIAHCDPQGALPPWLVNKVTHTLGPRMVKDLRKASLGYVPWKKGQTHARKPWRNPEEICCPRITVQDCLTPTDDDDKRPPNGVQQNSLNTTTAAESPTAKSKSAQSFKDLSSSNPLKFRKSLRLGKK